MKIQKKKKKLVDLWLASEDVLFFRRRIQMLPEKWEKVVASDRQYFQWYVVFFYFQWHVFKTNFWK